MSAKCKNESERLNGMRGMSFLIFSEIAKNPYGKCSNEFFSKISNVKIFAKLIGFLAVSHIQRSFHWLSSPFRSGVVANQKFASYCSGQHGH